ncbi:MAG: hypothetical protein IT258_19655 [Saprospiraceae bacterium]|nr:hypothetical protein [Saprospiraceae bacterium]
MSLQQLTKIFKKPSQAYLDWRQPHNKRALVRGTILTLLTMTAISLADYFYYAEAYYQEMGIAWKREFTTDNFFRLVCVPLINIGAIVLAKSAWNNSQKRLDWIAFGVLFFTVAGIWMCSTCQEHYTSDDYTYEVLVLMVFAPLLYGLSFRTAFFFSGLLVLSVLAQLAIDKQIELGTAIYDVAVITMTWVPIAVGNFKMEQAMRANFRAITQLEEANQGILKQATELKSKNHDLEQFAYASSHDLQEPLRTISNFVTILNKQLHHQMTEDQRLYMSLVLNSTERMKNLIHAILEYSRIGRNKQLERIDCNEMLKEVIADLNFSIEAANSTIKLGQLPVVNGYKAELATLFQNLISNALKFRKADIAPIVEISGSADEDGYLFCVSDNGIGIDPQFADKVFHLFSRLHNKDEYEGTGIGLTHSKKIVELHDGTIWLEHCPGGGAAFCFKISNSLINDSNEKETRLHHAD